MERFENAIFKPREEINDRMTKMFGLLKELTASQTPKKLLIREEARHPITKNINSISLIRIEEEKNVKNNRPIDKSVVEPNKSDEEEPPKGVDVKDEVERKVDGEPAKSSMEDVTKKEEEEPAKISSSHTGPLHDVILKKQITRKEDIGGNLKIPCNVGGLKNMNALVDQGSNVNIMPLSIYNNLADESPAETDIRLSLASHSYIYPLGIVEDMLVNVTGYVYPVNFVILDKFLL
ncbi:MAK10-like protein [Tanacetum coccineum]